MNVNVLNKIFGRKEDIMDSYKQILAENVHQLATQKGIGKTEACVKSGAGRSFISNMIGKDQDPSFDKVLNLAEYFNVSIDYLVGRSEKSSGELSSIDEELKYLLDLYQKLHEDDKIRIITKMETIIEDYPENKESVS